MAICVREVLARHRRAILAGLMVVGLCNALLLVRPWARDHVPATDMMTAAAVPAAAAQGAQPWLNLAKTQLLSEDEGRRFKAAAMFVSYFLISTRAMAQKCGSIGYDFQPVTATFARVHASEYERASDILSSHGLNAEFIWMFFADKLDALSASHLDQLAALDATDRAGICARIVAAPERFAESRGYRRNHPDLHGSLMR